MAKYSKKAQDKIGEVMGEFKKGKLKSSSGEKVTDRDQAVAIGISEAKDAGYKVPKQNDSSSSGSKSSSKKPSSKKSSSGKSTSKSKKSEK